MDPNSENLIQRLLTEAFGEQAPGVASTSDASEGRGVFSTVLRIELDWPHRRPDLPTHVVAKLPLTGPNGAAAAASGAYRREANAYRHLLLETPVATPQALSIVEVGGGSFGFLLDDLSSFRRVDQVHGMGGPDLNAVGEALGRLHRHWSSRTRELSTASVRRNVTTVEPTSIHSGFDVLTQEWSGVLSAEALSAFRSVAYATGRPITSFEQRDITLCHGDPRADNIVFDTADQPVLFDWQQTMAAPGELDLAWLAATSVTVEDRRRCERDLLASYDGNFDRYRRGFLAPATLVLLLVQRELGSERLQHIVETSLRRIGQALIDLEVTKLLD